MDFRHTPQIHSGSQSMYLERVKQVYFANAFCKTHLFSGRYFVFMTFTFYQNTMSCQTLEDLTMYSVQ
jgi:hypothetical protein